MKFCDEKIQKHLLNGGKIKRERCNFLIFLNNNGILCYQSDGHVHTCCINNKDLTADDWEIVKPEYDWDKIIKDKILCVFSHQEDFEYKAITTLDRIDNQDGTYFTSQGTWYKYCQPFNPDDYNIVKDLKEYEE